MLGKVGIVAFLGIACYGITYEMLTNLYAATGTYGAFGDDVGMFAVAASVIISIAGAVVVSKKGVSK